MAMHPNGSHPSNSEAGNAVALTLLGLALAILAGVAVLYWVGANAPEKITPLTQPTQETATSTASVDPRAGWQWFEDTAYSYSLQFPPGWVVATGTIEGLPVVTVAPGTLNASSTTSYHVAATRVSVYPLGYPGFYATDTEAQSGVIVPVPMASAKDLLLASKRPWATKVRFEKYPDSWSQEGYLLSVTFVEEESEHYFRNEAEISAQEFDVSKGDRFVREGFVDPTTRALQEEILRSFQFVSTATAPEQGVVADDSEIVIDEPRSGARISSPVQITGKARGTWYFEGSFGVQLISDTGEVLTEVPATAQGEWMTEEYVPFALSVTFEQPTNATSGVLVFRKDNPSGLPENERQVRVPVQFAQ